MRVYPTKLEKLKNLVFRFGPKTGIFAAMSVFETIVPIGLTAV